MRILVVDDEPDFVDAVARGLRLEGYAVDTANNGDEALDKATYTPYDLICLDLTMPGRDGLELCDSLRIGILDYPPPRILMLTARGTLSDRILGLDAGADDYLVKPFSLDELHARIRSLLRRDAGRSGAVLHVGGLLLDTARHRVEVEGLEIHLSPKEFSLLHYFLTRPTVVVSQEELLEHVWDENADPFTHTVRVTVGTLRRKLLASGAVDTIDTIVGKGYRFLPGGGVR